MLESTIGETTVISQKVTVSGLGGVGKTTTAIHFANHHEDKYQFIIWIDCGEGCLSKSFNNLRKDLKLEALDEWEEIPQKAYEKLSKYKCLFIFDNAESCSGMEG